MAGPLVTAWAEDMVTGQAGQDSHRMVVIMLVDFPKGTMRLDLLALPVWPTVDKAPTQRVP